MQTCTDSQIYMTAADVAEFTGYTKQTILKYKKEGAIRAYYPYGRQTPLFIKSEVMDYLLNRNQRPGPKSRF